MPRASRRRDKAKTITFNYRNDAYKVEIQSSDSNATIYNKIRSKIDEFEGIYGAISITDEQGNRLRAIEFPRIKGGKPFDTEQAWFGELLTSIGQSKGEKVTAAH